ncbi:hypothetical protein HK103_003862 [Boothiomyces macroporosus]|uniref:Guanylate cyclase domain-containing protein n=1 Tax=Boothiomyces macroporosus TaxID=261099 RepID=A0AAD5YB49_9FUNG|nr:hypothetical protein HK103_003862 [Boothiomyces macroporosus]
MGTDGGHTKKMSYMKSLKNLPMRFRSQKSQASIESKGETTPLSNSRQDMQADKKKQNVELEDETDTMAPNRNAEKNLNPKLVVRSTVAAAPPEPNEFSDPNTAPYLVYHTSYGDRNSSNGVRVNDQFVTPGVPTPLRAGDTIMIGSIKLLYYESLAAIPKQATKGTEDNLKLVTILPSLNSYDEKIAIKAEIEEENVDFKKVDLVTDPNVLREDYEKLRLAYELSKVTLTNDLSVHLEKSLDLIFEILPVDRGVVLLVDQNTGTLATHQVKLRSAGEEGKEIVLSSTILKRVYESRKCLVTTDATQDKSLQAAASVMHSQMRSVICLPLVGHNKVHGIIHLDSDDSITTFSRKDLSIVTAISNQTAIAIENSILMAEYEQNAKVKEHLSRFLAPHVVQRMSNPSEIIRKGGRQMVGTIIFVDIRGFTNMSEKSTPVEVVHLLNDYFERLVRIVFKYNGVVDKYIGDALMAVFGTLEDDKDAEFRGVSAAFEFKAAIKDMNEDRARFNKEPISIGVGVNTGDLLAGFIGSSQRLEYTVIGDSVNTSSRICSMSKMNQVLISEYTYEYVKDRIEAAAVGSRQFKGKQKEVLVYEVLSVRDKPLDPSAAPPVTVTPPTGAATDSELPTKAIESATEAKETATNPSEVKAQQTPSVDNNLDPALPDAKASQLANISENVTENQSQ